MIPRSPLFVVCICVFLFGCDKNMDSLLTNVPDPPAVVQPTIRPGMDTAIDIRPGAASRLLFLPRDSASYVFAVAGGITSARIALFDTAKFDTGAIRDSLSRSTNRIAWTANSVTPKWLVVVGQESSTKGAVLLSADITSGSDDFEPDGSRGSASWVSTDSLVQTHAIRAGDTDWVKFATVPRMSYSITIGSDYNANVRYRLYRDSLSATAFDSGYSLGFVKPAIATNIFVEIVGYSKQSSGCYTIAIASDSTNDKYEPDDTRAAAVRITTDSVVQRRFMQAAEHDWIKFDVVAGRGYRIAMDGESRLKGFRLFADEQAASPFDSGDASLAFKATKSGTVFVDLHSRNSSGRGGYSVAVSSDSSNDGFEPDDQRSNAVSIGVGTSQKRHLLAGEHDWFEFTADSGRNYRIVADSCRAKVGMKAYSGDGDSILAKSGSIMGLKAVKTGTIHVDLFGQDASGGDYRLSVSLDTTISDKYEPDDSWRQAAQITTDGTVQSRALQLGEHDWVRFQADSGSSYLVAARGVEGTWIKYFLDSVGRYPIDRFERIGAITASRTAWIYLDLSGSAGERSGNYSLSVTKNDAFEPDNTRETATTIATDSTPQLHLITAADHDWIKFEATQGNSYTISVSIPTEVYHQDVVFDVYDEANPWRWVISGTSYIQPMTYTATKSGTVRIDFHGSDAYASIAYFASVKAK